jgi:predicted ATPase
LEGRSSPIREFVHERADGNALFTVNIVEHLMLQGLVVLREGQWTLRQGAKAKVVSLLEGLQQLEALMLVATTEERWWEAELYRLKGELLLQLPTPDIHQAGASFHQALNVTRRQQAKALALRAASSLSRLWQGHSKHDEARQLLAPIYGWFTEGFDMPDLWEAQGLLTAITAPSAVK